LERLGDQKNTKRGFPLIEFDDCYGVKSSLQASSLAQYEQPGTSAIWLGCDNADPRILASQANNFGIETLETTGWVPFPIPAEVLMTTRMHLNREQVQALINHLQTWLDSDTGQFV